MTRSATYVHHSCSPRPPPFAFCALRRLERNRATARARRELHRRSLGAKEKEVRSLERVLAILQTHTWGSGDGEAIANALGGTSRTARACSVPRKSRSLLLAFGRRPHFRASAS